ncbi:hypothetical protein TIFTF001_011669 [Ficus carica]|uniref:Uncharacterized protein n=1 Tax=Ficus carica TaxID=3494 RepID=A0AA88A0Y3_FICCA|nr:hypothetical protein TIFTF001_011669 [Ficus carica]
MRVIEKSACEGCVRSAVAAADGEIVGGGGTVSGEHSIVAQQLSTSRTYNKACLAEPFMDFNNQQAFQA